MKTTQKSCKFDFEEGDPVALVPPTGNIKMGTIVRTIKKDQRAIIQLKNGKKLKVKLQYLKPSVDLETDNEEMDVPDFEVSGFTQYDVQWDKGFINFKLKNDIGLFYGWWRKVSAESFIIDLLFQASGKSYNCETLHYTSDPRDDLDSLNADICAAVNKWHYSQCRGSLDTLKSLELKAAKPIIHITSLSTIDNLLIELREYRDTALKSGGFYTYMFTGDNEGDPSMRIAIDLSKQAKGLDGRIPGLLTGAALDHAADTDGRSRKTQKKQRVESGGLNQSSISSIIDKLKVTTDKAQQRKLRAILRKLGHRGGAKAVK